MWNSIRKQDKSSGFIKKPYPAIFWMESWHVILFYHEETPQIDAVTLAC